MIKTDCFAWNETRGCCNALTDLMCKRGGCPFYKTQQIREQEEALCLVNKPAKEKQPVYADKPVIREDGKRYESAKEAAAEAGISVCYIIKAANGEQITSAGYHWQWADR